MLSQSDGAIKAKRWTAEGVGQKSANAGRALAFILLVILALSARMPIAAAQGLDATALLKPATDTWPTYNGDYSGARYSTLDQISAKNIDSLTLAWAFRTHGHVLKSTPLEVNGILYLTAPDNVWAVDARFGREIWHYQRQSEGDHIGHRGLGMYKNWLYFTTPDAHLVCLDAKDGKVHWDVELADVKLGYFSTMAPLVIRDHVIAGVSGDVTDVRGFLKSIDPETGATQWTWYTDPDPGQPGSETWPKDSDAILHGGGMTWMTGTYDPDLNLLYWGTGNPNPVLAGEGRRPRRMTCTTGMRWRRQSCSTPNSRARNGNCLRRPAATGSTSCWIERTDSTWQRHRSSTKHGLPELTRMDARWPSQKRRPLRTARWLNPARTERRTGWHRALIRRRICSM